MAKAQYEGEMKIDVENNYAIYQNAKNEIMFSVLERDSEQGSPLLIYDGGEHALLLRNSGHAVILDYINKEVRRSLLEAKEVLIAEHPKDEKENFVREYIAPVNIVKEMPVKFVKQPSVNNYDDDAPEKAGERIRKMLRDDPGMVTRIVQFYTDMANDGNAGAQFELANLYLEGLGVEKDEAKAMDLIKKSAQNGHPQAIEFLKDAKK